MCKKPSSSDTDISRARWVSYLDLMGIKDLVKTRGWIEVLSYYEQAIEYFKRDFHFKPQIEKIYFSDTFLMYSSDDTASSLTSIDAMTRWFINLLVSHDFPVRGAMACGDFYADKENNIFFGKAFINAYQYGENQDWIGFILSPTAVKQMAAVAIPADEWPHYSYCDIPYRKELPADFKPENPLPAYLMCGSDCLNHLCSMRDGLKAKHASELIIEKYEKTINFIETKTGFHA